MQTSKDKGICSFRLSQRRKPILVCTKPRTSCPQVCTSSCTSLTPYDHPHMGDFSIKSILKRFDSIDNKYKSKSVTIDNIDNVISNNNPSRYALREDYEPRTKESVAAHEICERLNDCHNFALHYATVKRIGASEAYRLLHETLDDLKEATKTGKSIKNPAALYNWKVGQLLHQVKKL